MRLPEGISERVFRDVLREFSAVVGSEWVFSSDEDIALYRDAYTPFPGEPDKQYIASAAVSPTTVDQVQQIVRIANKHKVPLYPVSTGRNLGYGGSSPTYSGSVIVDLKRMNRIIEINTREGYMIVEPGTNFIELHRHFKANSIPYVLSSPQPGWGSPIGNALDHGSGAVVRDNYSMVKGMEVVLPDGEVLRTGAGAVPTGKLWANYQYGFGPFINGMFCQSNLGIVTKMCFSLVPVWETQQGFTLTSYRTEDMQPMIDALLRLHLEGVLDGWAIESPIRESMSTNDGRRPYGVPQVRALLRGTDGGTIAEWDALGRSASIPVTRGTGYARGPTSVVNAKLAHAREVLSRLPDAAFELGRATAGADLPGPTIEFGFLAIQESNLGHYYFSAICKPVAEDIFAINDTIRRTLLEVGDLDLLDNFGWSAGRGAFYGGKSLLILLEFLVYEDVAKNQRRRELLKKLADVCAQHGWPQCRAPVAFQSEVMEQYSFNNGVLRRFHETVKDALDPNGILAPGKSGIWPKHLRKS
jgi:(+)-pinoresinol hydroxylase